MENEFIPQQTGGSLRFEPDHDYGTGKYYKLPGSGKDDRGYFAFIKAVYNHRFYEEEVDHVSDDQSIPVRCDAGAPKAMPMPAALHEEDEETGLCKTCGSSEPIYGTTNSHHASLSNSKILRMPFHGYKGFITYIELFDADLEEDDVIVNSNVARTLQELFRLMLEWEWVYNNLDQNDICAKLSYEMLQEMELPESIRQWLWDEVPPMHVERFLKGDENARSRPDPKTIPDMSYEFEHWCWVKIVLSPPTWKYGVR